MEKTKKTKKTNYLMVLGWLAGQPGWLAGWLAECLAGWLDGLAGSGWMGCLGWLY